MQSIGCMGMGLIHGECINEPLELPVRRILVLPDKPDSTHARHIKGNGGMSIATYRKVGGVYEFFGLWRRASSACAPANSCQQLPRFLQCRAFERGNEVVQFVRTHTDIGTLRDPTPVAHGAYQIGEHRSRGQIIQVEIGRAP